jgi:hypothetical protein
MPRPHISRIHVAARRKVSSRADRARQRGRGSVRPSAALIPPVRPRQALESCGAPTRIRGRGLYLVSVMIGLVARGALVVAPALAWGPADRVQGRVSWVAAETLIVSTDDTPSVRVDLSQVDRSLTP